MSKDPIGADQLASALLDADIFDTVDASPVIGTALRATFWADIADGYEYGITVVRHRKETGNPE